MAGGRATPWTAYLLALAVIIPSSSVTYPDVSSCGGGEADGEVPSHDSSENPSAAGGGEEERWEEEEEEE